MRRAVTAAPVLAPLLALAVTLPARAEDPAPASHATPDQAHADAAIASLLSEAETSLTSLEPAHAADAATLLVSALALLPTASPAGQRLMSSFPARLRRQAVQQAAAGHAEAARRLSIFADAAAPFIPPPGGGQPPAAIADTMARQGGTTVDQLAPASPPILPSDGRAGSPPGRAPERVAEAAPVNRADRQGAQPDGPVASPADAAAASTADPGGGASGPAERQADRSATPAVIDTAAASGPREQPAAAAAPDAPAGSPDAPPVRDAAVGTPPASAHAADATSPTQGPDTQPSPTLETQAPGHAAADSQGQPSDRDDAGTVAAAGHAASTPDGSAGSAAARPTPTAAMQATGHAAVAVETRGQPSGPAGAGAAAAAGQAGAIADRSPPAPRLATATDAPPAASRAEGGGASPPPSDHGGMAMAQQPPATQAAGQAEVATVSPADHGETAMAQQPPTTQADGQAEAAMPHLAPPPVAAAQRGAEAANHPPAPASPPLPPGLREALLRRGEAMLQLGDISAARLLFGRAAESGVALAARKLGDTYNPLFLAQHGWRGIQPDPAVAEAWYRKAMALGEASAAARLNDMADFTGVAGRADAQR